MSYTKVKELNLKYFSKLLKKYDDDHHIVAQSRVSHLKRFEKLIELGDFNNKRILDVGCGIGGFYAFLKDKGIRADYTGVDINPNMIGKAQRKFPAIRDKFFVIDILEEKITQHFDYVLSNGPLNLAFEDRMNVELTVKMINMMYEMATIGIAITMTSSLTRKPNPDTFYYDPMEIFSRIIPLCTNIRLDHSYLPHDFTLFCYKKNLYDF